MHSRALGKTGIQVSEVGLGAWQLGEPSWNGPGDQESLRIVDEALALGCTSANARVNGQSSEVGLERRYGHRRIA